MLETCDRDLVRKGSQLGSRTLDVPKELGRSGLDLMTRALVMAEHARVRQRGVQGVQPELEVETSATSYGSPHAAQR